MKSIKPSDLQEQRRLALWAADCAERVLPFFEKIPAEDDRPRLAIEAARAWVRGEIDGGAARDAAVAAHAAAREADEGAARDAARAAGHAAATAHMVAHAHHAAAYAVKAAISAANPAAAGTAAAAERNWQRRSLHLASSAE
ncbi:MAG: putative immunity protein [Terrimicrobiaceae bacterium]